jgi:hypothetical protein
MRRNVLFGLFTGKTGTSTSEESQLCILKQEVRSIHRRPKCTILCMCTEPLKDQNITFDHNPVERMCLYGHFMPDLDRFLQVML